MKKIIAIFLILFFSAAPFTIVKASTFKSYKVIITTSRLNVRSTASTKGKIVGYYYKNNIVDVTGQSGSWLKTSKGYISSSYTRKYTASTASRGSTPTSFSTYKVIITTSKLNIRSTASTSGKITGYYYLNNIVDIIGQSGSWLKTSKGYISSGYTKKYTASAASTTPAPSTSFSTYKVIITTSRLNIRSTASTSGKIVGYYYLNNVVDIIGQSGSWLKTSKGYISSGYTKKYTASTPSRGDTQTQPVKSICQISDAKYYNTNIKEVVAIPITQTVSPSTGNINEQLIPVYSADKNETSIQVTVNDTAIKTQYSKSFDTLKKNVSINNVEGNKVQITADFAENADVNVYTVRKKASTEGNVQTLETYIVLSFSQRNSGQPQGSAAVQKPLVVIDPGHGGTDPGACANGLKEDELNLDISLKLKQDLENQGYDTYITRSTDSYVDLYERPDAANILKADLFISIHNNANGTSSYNGTTVLYNSSAVISSNDLPQIMEDEITKAIGTNTLRLEDRPGLVVLNCTWMPSVLAEVAVLTNSSDAAIISKEENRQAVADAMLRAVNKYFGF